MYIINHLSLFQNCQQQNGNCSTYQRIKYWNKNNLPFNSHMVSINQSHFLGRNSLLSLLSEQQRLCWPSIKWNLGCDLRISSSIPLRFPSCLQSTWEDSAKLHRRKKNRKAPGDPVLALREINSNVKSSREFFFFFQVENSESHLSSFFLHVLSYTQAVLLFWSWSSHGK